jgi:3-hydroxyisobutyrate dehydrogenase-like beta-hydroxyacid dehydrogenase
MKPKVGFVGLGNIGEPMCRCLLENGYEVSIYDVNPEAVSKLGDTAAEPAENLKVLASSAEVVLLSLPGSDVVEEAVLGERGLVEGLSSGKVLIDTSSSRPSSTRDLAEKLAESGVEMLDAPVSGGVLRAEEGKLAVMVGGREEVFERHREVLEAFGERIFHVGDHGAGHLVKSLNNLLSATTLASAAEAPILAQKAGVALETLLEVINAGNGRSYSTEVKFPNFILNRSFDDGFALGLMVKELKIALETAAEMGHPMFSGSAISQLWQAAFARGHGPEGHTSIYAFLENLSREEEGDGRARI